MVEINWTLIIYLLIGLFAISGYFKGWWKEALTTFFLGFLVFLLQAPDVAQWLIDQINGVLNTIWGWLPDALQTWLTTILQIESSTGLRIDATSRQTWLVILLLLIGLTILMSRSLLYGQLRSKPPYVVYPVTPFGSFLGGLLGALNGFLIINLVREYLVGSSLPQGVSQPVTELAMTSGNRTIGVASSGIGLLLTELPQFTVLSSTLAWIVVGFGLLVTLLVFGSGATPSGYTRINIVKEEEENTLGLLPVETDSGSGWMFVWLRPRKSK